MEPVMAAVMLLLSCSPGEASVCKPVETAPALYASLEECRTSLVDTLAKSPNGEIIGRCRAIDLTATASLPKGYKTVQVTRGIGHGTVTSYLVPHDPR
ncbi:hypothetical protein EN829_020195 [Mesorhizobium sp. M00.F.Ca.ET.186.01.1.1]|nr:hypothetical protein EN848_29160 [bacterium M00.F.Ca.ET.205.01.1.1]TGU50353.1 hypothetical protein EN795_22240 [bacterium M00.F.Ca.ET.152.01.1.1]TGV33829.1 hypothetical protein EN829_020195 [Mesorhizobium sp. M00.F.Ca.ET.186.01.1.1]TGZ40717.1 hypothetical protein EN805_21635 [bacterium M00.F.Ca.ET.162.01.1.1]